MMGSRPDSRASHYTQGSQSSGYGSINGNYMTNGQYMQQQQNFYDYGDRASANSGMW